MSYHTANDPRLALRQSLATQLSDIGGILRGARITRGMSVAVIAKRLGVTEVTIRRIEHGYPCKLNTLYEYACVVGATVRINIYAPMPKVIRE